jgi:hypothetical protein
VTAADWVSRNRYVRVSASFVGRLPDPDSERRTDTLNAFIESFLRSFPSTLH